MMACFLAKIKAEVETNKAKTGTNLREMRASQELLKEEILAKLHACHERMMARMDFQLEKMEACLGNMESTDLEADPEEIESKVEHEEVPKEEAAV
jgi:hypothetical protein